MDAEHKLLHFLSGCQWTVVGVVLISLGLSVTVLNASAASRSPGNSDKSPGDICTGVVNDPSYFNSHRDEMVDDDKPAHCNPKAIAGKGECSLSRTPLAPADLAFVEPLGHLSPPSHIFPTDHVYLYKKDGEVELPVFSPGRTLLTSVTRNKFEGPNPSSDYALTLALCHRFKIKLDHLATVSSRVSTALRKSALKACERPRMIGDSTVRSCQYFLSLRTKAGERIATAASNSAALDLGVEDADAKALPFLNPARYPSDVKRKICPLNLFTPKLKANLLKLMGGSTSKRTATPLCGEFMEDKPGTVQGNWVQESTFNISSENTNLALVHDNIDPSIPMFSVGTSLTGLNSDIYPYPKAGSGYVNRDFADVKRDGSTYCFEITPRTGGQTSGIIILTLESKKTLKIEYQTATSCSSGPWFFTANAVQFVR